MFASLLAGAIGIQLPMEQTLALARKVGFAGVALSIGEAAQLGAAETADLYARHGLRVGSWSLPVQFRTDQATFDRDMAALPRLAKAAERVGADRCSTWIMPGSDEFDYDTNFQLHANRLGMAARVLGDYGSRLGLEFVGPKTLRAGKKHAFIHDMPGMFELIGAIGVPGTGLLLDCFHWFTSHDAVEDLEAITAADIIDVHVNDAIPGRSPDEQIDNERALPGETGVIDIKGFLGALHKLGYQGPIGAEPFSKRVKSLPAEQAAAETVESMKKIWAAAAVPWTGPRA